MLFYCIIILLEAAKAREVQKTRRKEKASRTKAVRKIATNLSKADRNKSKTDYLYIVSINKSIGYTEVDHDDHSTDDEGIFYFLFTIYLSCISNCRILY